MNWYKTAKIDEQLQEALKGINPSLLKNKYFLYGVDGESFPEGGDEMSRLTGDEWRKADAWMWVGFDWKHKYKDPEGFERRRRHKFEEEKRNREIAERQRGATDKTYNLQEWSDQKDNQTEDLVRHFSDPSRIGRLETVED